MDYAYLAKFLTVIISVAISDVCWTFYFITIENKKAIASGIWSSVIMLLGAFSVSNYAHDKSFITAAVIGAFIGTSGSVYYKIWKDKRNKLKENK